MSLIRNGGFERGNTDFWHVESGGTLEIDSANQKFGNFCGKFISTINQKGKILLDDYIKVTPSEIIHCLLWVKSSSSTNARPMIYTYDIGYSLIGSILGNAKDMDGTYLMLDNQFIVPNNCVYIRIGCEISSITFPADYYIDGAMVNILTEDNAISGVLELLPAQDYSSSKDLYNQGKDMKQFSTYYAQLFCGNVTGTDPTLDVEVKEIDEFGHQIVLGTFTHITAAFNERIDLPHCQGNQMYLKYTITGTDAIFNFGVSVIGKR